ncbi:Fc.00g055050.m01.CDS01 [Cosmosporella sp. VM-42]
MKLIIAGATGLVATEIIKQSLEIREITSIIALSRSPLQINDTDTNSSKLKNVIVGDYGEYPGDVKAEFVGADACIWYGSITNLCLP